MNPRLIELATLAGQEVLDDLVHQAKMDEGVVEESGLTYYVGHEGLDRIYDRKAEEAASINNQGRIAQLEYLLIGETEENIIKLLEESIEEQKASSL